jgi:putative addiction module component (TIGR02574 family)
MPNKKDVLSSALMLSAEERAEVAGALLESLDEEPPDDPATVQAAWEAEIESRASEVLSGRVKGVNGFELLEKARAELRERVGKK